MKRIHDYFEPSAKRQKQALTPTSVQRAGGPQARPTGNVPGLSIASSFITAAEESALLAFLDTQQWRTDLARRTIHYGGTYCLMPPRGATASERLAIEKTIIDAPRLPVELDFVIDRMVQQHLYNLDAKPQYCIVNEYQPGQGISAHVENFRFGEPVCSLTLAGEDAMRFHELKAADDGSVRSGKAYIAPRTGRHIDVTLARRSLAILTGDARSKWQHEIVRGRTKRNHIGWRRVSLTFRAERSGT